MFHTIQCAQRLSASEIRHTLKLTILFSKGLVLNAFRHQRFDTYLKIFKKRVEWSAQRLSASEIRHTQSTTKSLLEQIRAQRLSASEIRHVEWTCLSDATKKVLNAFRHQRFDTTGDTGQQSGDASAQRLSASEIRHTLLAEAPVERLGAQRLSASEIRHNRKSK